MDGDPGFGTILRSLRAAAGLSQESLAELARLSPESISALERGTRRAPYRETVRLLSDALALAAADRARLEAAATRHSRPRAGGPKVPKTNLPPALTSFRGRDEALVELRSLLDRARLVTVVGPGGVGKTRLAIEAAAAHARRFPGGVWFIDLAPLRDGSPIAASIAAVLGVRERGGTELESSLVARLEAGDELLLVLDNCEHVLSNVARVAELLLRRCARVQLLATTREPLRIGGEMLFAVETLGAEPAAHLFVDRATAVSRDIDPVRDRASIASIVRRLDGLPLAIELAAARLRSLSPRQIADALDARFHILTMGRRTALPRQQTLHATLEWSHDLLSQRERDVFRRCAIFAGSWALADAKFVCDGGGVDEWEVGDCVGSLVDKSLVVARRDEGIDAMRFSMLETTHQYALERLENIGEYQQIAERHLDYFKGLVERANVAYEATGSDAQLAALAPELDNLRFALHWSLSGGNAIAGAGLSAASGRLWHRLGLSGEGIRRMRASASRIAEEGTPLAAKRSSRSRPRGAACRWHGRREIRAR
jgi:predicted ATPase/DNA-binding XRE family transcriptional regulator